MTPWNARDMWLSARSENTTEYSSSPSGSTSGSKPGMITPRTATPGPSRIPDARRSPWRQRN